jgi:hypothetical protein
MVLVSARFVRGAQTGCSLERSRPAVLGIQLHSQSMSLPQRAGVKRMLRRGEAGEDRLQIHVFYTLNAASLRHTWTFRSPVDRRRISLLSAFRRDESKQKSSSLLRLPFFGPPSQPKPARPQEVSSKQILRKIEGVVCSAQNCLPHEDTFSLAHLLPGLAVVDDVALFLILRILLLSFPSSSSPAAAGSEDPQRTTLKRLTSSGRTKPDGRGGSASAGGGALIATRGQILGTLEGWGAWTLRGSQHAGSSAGGRAKRR